MSNTVKLVVALALTAVTATGALAASRHKGVYPRAYSGYAYVPAFNAYPNTYSVYPNLAEPTRGWAYAPRAFWGGYNYFNLYNPYPYLGP
jgi:hypothetical protein